jgi:HSP20 family protein
MVIDFSTLYDAPQSIERLFEDMMRRGSSYRRPQYPQVNIQENDGAYVVDINIPGVPAEGLDLTLTARNLIIRGERTSPEGRYFRQERMAGVFQRVLSLNVPVERDKVTAKSENGIVRVVLPKAREARPRKISIES